MERFELFDSGRESGPHSDIHSDIRPDIDLKLMASALRCGASSVVIHHRGTTGEAPQPKHRRWFTARASVTSQEFGWTIRQPTGDRAQNILSNRKAIRPLSNQTVVILRAPNLAERLRRWGSTIVGSEGRKWELGKAVQTNQTKPTKQKHELKMNFKMNLSAILKANAH